MELFSFLARLQSTQLVAFKWNFVVSALSADDCHHVTTSKALLPNCSLGQRCKCHNRLQFPPGSQLVKNLFEDVLATCSALFFCSNRKKLPSIHMNPRPHSPYALDPAIVTLLLPVELQLATCSERVAPEHDIVEAVVDQGCCCMGCT
jgi:hypothetical protein